MKIGIPSEVKADEYRVGLLPVGAHLLAREGHLVNVQTGAGIGSGFTDEDFRKSGASIVDSAEEVYRENELIVKVKEPQPAEIKLLKKDSILFCYFHFAASQQLTRDCLDAGINALAFETLADAQGGLPLLKPMSEVAGRMSIQEAAKHLEKPMQGRGILLGGIAGVQPANVLVLGAGIVGANAARMAAGLGANVVLMDVNLDRLRYLDEVMPANVSTVFSDPHTISHHSMHADAIIGAVLIPGAKAPHLLDSSHIKRMKPGAVIVDVSIDQGGCIETARPTTHQNPTYLVDDVVHYCVTNIPGAVGRTSSLALGNATLPYVRQLAGLGLEKFLKVDGGHAEALNLSKGKITNNAVRKAFQENNA